jgi:hypothetical protein
MTGMKTDWSILALAICGDSAALTVAFIQEIKEPIKKYLFKKGEPATQRNIDSAGLRFANRYIDYRVNQDQIAADKEPMFKYGFGFNTTKRTSGKTAPTTGAFSVAGPSGTASKKSVGGSVGVASSIAGPSGTKSGGGSAGVVSPVASASTASGASSSSSPAVASSSGTDVPSAFSSARALDTTSIRNARISELAATIQTAMGASCDQNSALKIAEIFESGVMEAAKIPGMTTEVLTSIEASLARLNAGADSTATKATESDTAGASSSAGTSTVSDTTATASSGSNKAKKKRQAVKKGGRRR